MSFLKDLVSFFDFGGIDIGSLTTASVKESYLMGKQNDYNSALQKDADKRAFDYGQSAQRSAALNQIFGLQSAGLSPALASSAQFSAGPSISGSSNGVSIPSGGDSLGTLFGFLNQTKLANAQSKLLTAQADNINFDIGEKYGERLVLNQMAQDFMEKEIKSGSEFSDAYRKILSDNTAVTGGSARALAYWQQFASNKDDAQARSIANSFVNEVYAQKKTNGAARILAELPHRELQKFAMDLTLNNASVANIISQTDVNNAQLREIAAHTHQMLTESDFKYHKDFAAMWKNGDYSAAAASLFASALESASGAAGFAVGARAANGKAPRANMAPTSKKAFTNLNKLSPLKNVSQSVK